MDDANGLDPSSTLSQLPEVVAFQTQRCSAINCCFLAIGSITRASPRNQAFSSTTPLLIRLVARKVASEIIRHQTNPPSLICRETPELRSQDIDLIDPS
eukprot:m.239235 g.239235  ORF g.239235 m.239235 type:complete len:99 (-) comp15294_c1_seq2:226-522(-)